MATCLLDSTYSFDLAAPFLKVKQITCNTCIVGNANYNFLSSDPTDSIDLIGTQGVPPTTHQLSLVAYTNVTVLGMRNGNWCCVSRN